MPTVRRNKNTLFSGSERTFPLPILSFKFKATLDMNIICYQIIAIQEVLALDLEVASLAGYQVGVK